MLLPADACLPQVLLSWDHYTLSPGFRNLGGGGMGAPLYNEWREWRDSSREYSWVISGVHGSGTQCRKKVQHCPSCSLFPSCLSHSFTLPSHMLLRCSGAIHIAAVKVLP